MILGNLDIKGKYETGDIVIHPFNENLLNPASYNIRLDEFFVATDQIQNFGHVDLSSDDKIKYNKFKSDSIILPPFGRILGSSIEQIGSISTNITTQLHARSTLGRKGVEICSCAGYGDPGYATHWTLELYNKNQYPVILKKGMEIGQISFSYVLGCNKKYSSVYNQKGGLKEYNDDERYSMMIPKTIKVSDYDFLKENDFA